MVVIGKYLRGKFVREDESDSRGGVNSLLGALFGLWAFLLAFTFGNSSSRFENVRNIMVEETNGLRSAILRSDVFPDSVRAGLRYDLKEYIDTRIDYFNDPSNVETIIKLREKSIHILNSLWHRTVLASASPNLNVHTNNMLNTLSGIMDNASKRDALLLSGIPEPIQYMLFFLGMTISFIGGFTTPDLKIKEWLVILGFALLATCIIFISIDLGRPLRGIIKPDLGEARLVELQKMLE